MAAADNISQLRAVDDAADTAVAVQIAAYGVPAYQPGDGNDLPDIFALPQFILGPSAHLHRTPIGGREFDLWTDCIVSVELICPRVVDVTTPAGAVSVQGVYNKLGELAVRVRHALAPDRLAELNGRLAFHHLTRPEPLADVRGYDDERKLDRHELRWRLAAGIKLVAWPTDPAAYNLPAT